MISHVVLIDCAGVHVVNDMDDDIENTHKSTKTTSRLDNGDNDVDDDSLRAWTLGEQQGLKPQWFSSHYRQLLNHSRPCQITLITCKPFRDHL